MSDSLPYSVRDPYGNVYGPANAELLQQWVSEGRIIPGMAIGEMIGGAMAWQEASTHPVLAPLFQRAQLPSADAPGLPLPPSGQPGPQPPGTAGQLDYSVYVRPSRLPMTSLVLGVLAFLFAVPSALPLLCCCGGLAVPLGLAGAIIGTLALFQTPAADASPTGRMRAWIGLSLSLLSLLITLLGIIFTVSQWGHFGP